MQGERGLNITEDSSPLHRLPHLQEMKGPTNMGQAYPRSAG